VTFTTRFAPSPTGPLHLGHAYSAILAHDMARAAEGQFLLRIEDTDTGRARPKWEALITQDLHWLGLTWDGEPRRQSDHLSDFTSAITRLAGRGLIYPCSCNRSDIRAALSAPQEGVDPHGPDGLIYPGTCRSRAMSDRTADDALRLNMQAALASLPDPLPHWRETGPFAPGLNPLDHKTLVTGVGDVVLSRRLIGTAAYHLAVTVDDALQGITHVIRGADVASATQIHVLLQALLGLPTPNYHHHALIRDEDGKRLAKRDDARAIRNYRAEGATPADIRRMLGFPDQS
jgi:glutamyl-Q tRNA(Asp) synthetase